MNLRDNKRGWSRIEVFCIVGIGLILAFLLFLGVRYHFSQMDTGNDALRLNAAESVARTNWMTTGCVVTGCSETSETCPHELEGETMGYYDPVTKKILAEKIKGYNEHPIDHREKNTLIIRVIADSSNILLEWVEGDNRS